ncbi:chemotaxis protein CheB [Marinicella litoralis]|uniref:protein-glutamate methylesterase n=1 Tax=Marinicella litoralis TaxID=644220 RepID=A0A4R6XJ56_9GAMM|nr:chemotaxis protein CheB [Marinicella litoralis]TDR19522.1 CheB methylesterase [Marinicella litoralis]
MPSEQVVGLIHIGSQQPSAQFLINQLKLSGYGIQQYDQSQLDEVDHEIKTFIVNLFDNEVNIDEIIVRLSEHKAKVIFNDAQISNELVGWNKNRWLRHVLHKIDASHDILPEVKPEVNSNDGLDLKSMGIESVWVLAASIGGPESLIKFFKEFEGDEPILFIIVQHMDSEFSSMMEKQLNKNKSIPVKLAEAGVKILPSQALLIPVDEDINIKSDGTIAVKDVNHHRISTPCIDDVCSDMIENLEQINMAIFSGMAKDGVKGAINVFENGGKVITQSAESCVVSAIAEEVRKLSMSLFDGDPVSMAQYIKESITK